MNNDLLKRIDEAHFALLNGMNHEELDVLLRDCRAEIERKPYVPMTDAELKKLDDSLESFWHSDSYGVSIDTYCAIKAIESAIIKRAGLEIKHD